MPIVKMPDGQMVEMPDKPTPEQRQALELVLTASGSVGDMAADAVQNSPQARLDTLLQQKAQLRKQAQETFRGGKYPSEEMAQEEGLAEQIRLLESQMSKQRADAGGIGDKLAHYGRMGASAVGRGLATLPGLAAAAGHATNPMGSETSPAEPMISAARIGQAPQGDAERFIAAGLEAGTAGISSPGPGSFAAKGIIGASSGVGAEVGAKLGGDDALSRIIGALAGGAVPTAISKVTPNATKLIREATSEVPDTAFRRAEAIKRTLDENNIPSLSSQLLGPRSSLDDVVADAAANPKVRPRILARVERIPERAEQALTNWKAQALPVNASSVRETLGDVQEAAARKITGLEQGGANAAYSAALPAGTSASTYTPQQVKALAEQFRTLSRDPNYYGPATGGGRFLNAVAARIEKSLEKSKLVDAAGKPIETPVPKGYINNLLKDLNTLSEKTGYKGKGLADAKALLKGGTPEFGPARAAKAAFMETKVNPVKKGLAGELADMGGGVRPDKFTAKATAIDRVFPKNIEQPREIRQLTKDIGVDEVAALFREHMSRTMQNTFKSASAPAGTNQPAKLVDELLGTKAQRRNTAAVLEAVSKQAGADPRFVKHGFYKLMRALQTTRDIKVPSSVDRVALQQKAGENLPGYVVALMSRVSRSLWNRMSEKTYGKIADIVLAPDGIKQIEKIAKSPSPAYATAYAVSVLEQALAEQDSEAAQQEQQ